MYLYTVPYIFLHYFTILNSKLIWAGSYFGQNHAEVWTYCDHESVYNIDNKLRQNALTKKPVEKPLFVSTQRVRYALKTPFQEFRRLITVPKHMKYYSVVPYQKCVEQDGTLPW